jgi:succinate-acetate transporter protein
MLSTSSYPAKINALWTAFLLGLLFHTDLALMPLFHEMEIEHSHAGGDVNAVFGFMLLFFVLPMLAIVASTFTVTKSYRVFHFYLTLVYSVLNLGHLIADIVVGAPWYQLVLMTILVIIGLLLNLVSFQWLKK